MTRQSKNLQPSLIQDERPASCWRPHRWSIWQMVEALLREIATALTNGRPRDEQDHD